MAKFVSGSILPIVLILGECVIIPFLVYGLTHSIMTDIRSKWVNEKVHTKMNRACVDRFYKDVDDAWFRSSSFKSEATVVVYKTWKKDGRWEECVREDERV